MAKKIDKPEGRHNGRITVAIFVTVLVVLTGFALFTNLAHWPFGESSAKPAASSGMEMLTLVTASGEHAFEVEVMKTDADRARGLMERRFMPADRGMLFDFEDDQPVSMWMRNTYIPLDMVFIDRKGTVRNIAANTEPLSERTVSSEGPVRAVLEINAGTSAKIGLKPGDKVRNGMFRN
jgi:uncharacterized membrane protein (UPF0127 family)